MRKMIGLLLVLLGFSATFALWPRTYANLMPLAGYYRAGNMYVADMEKFGDGVTQTTRVTHIKQNDIKAFNSSNGTWVSYLHVPQRFIISVNASWNPRSDNESAEFYLINSKSLIVYVTVWHSTSFMSLGDALRSLRNSCGGEKSQACSISEVGQRRIGAADAYEFVMEETFANPQVRDVTKRSILAVERATGDVYLAMYYVFVEGANDQTVNRVAATVYDKYFEQANRSISSLRFVVKISITVQDMPLSLNPSVTLDEVLYSNLPVTFWMEYKSNHTISVEPIFPGNSNSTRYSFRMWSNGVENNSQIISINRDAPEGISYIATFGTDYLVTVSSDLGRPEGRGWFHSGTVAVVRVASYLPMSDLIGILGGKWIFAGWYDQGTLVSNSNEAQILVSKPYALHARWSADYTVPVILLILAAAAISLLTYYSTRLRRSK